jgi:hypothetical protein
MIWEGLVMLPSDVCLTNLTEGGKNILCQAKQPTRIHFYTVTSDQVDEKR